MSSQWHLVSGTINSSLQAQGVEPSQSSAHRRTESGSTGPTLQTQHIYSLHCVGTYVKGRAQHSHTETVHAQSPRHTVEQTPESSSYGSEDWNGVGHFPSPHLFWWRVLHSRRFCILQPEAHYLVWSRYARNQPACLLSSFTTGCPPQAGNRSLLSLPLTVSSLWALAQFPLAFLHKGYKIELLEDIPFIL